MVTRHFICEHKGKCLPINVSLITSPSTVFGLAVILFILDSLASLRAETSSVTLTPGHTQYSLNSAFDYLEDPGGQFTLAMVSTGAMADQFTRYQGSGAPNFGTTSSTFWLRFHWHNPLDIPQTIFLDIENALLDDVSIYQLDADNRRMASWRTGDAHPFSTRAEPQRTFVFQLVVPPEHSGSVYARIQSVNTLSFPATLWQPAAFRAHLELIHIAIGIYFGIMLVMAFYNSFLYVGTREQAYLFYVLYLLVFMLFQATLMGLVALYWQEASPWWINRAPLLVNPLSVIFTALFVRSFLRSGEYLPMIDKLILAVMVVGIIIILSVLFTNALHTIEIVTQMFDIVAVLIAIVASAMIWRKGLRIARFFLIAWSMLMTGVVINVLRAVSILPSIWLTDYAVYIGSILEVTLLSIALADRINVLRQEKIDEHKKAALERERLIAQLEVKNEALERFNYTVSHDLKSPLITIRGFTRLLEQDALKNNKARIQQDVERILTATQTMGELLDDLLELSRVGRLINPPEMIDMNSLVKEVLLLLEGQISQTNVIIEVSPNLPIALGDRKRLLEVWQNLIENALKFTRDQAEPHIQIGVRPGKFPVFYVADNGIGVDPKHYDKIFGLFERLRPRDFEGTGIGLAVVKRIIELHHGSIWVELAPGGTGSIFCFKLGNSA